MSIDSVVKDFNHLFGVELDRKEVQLVYTTTYKFFRVYGRSPKQAYQDSRFVVQSAMYNVHVKKQEEKR